MPEVLGKSFWNCSRSLLEIALSGLKPSICGILSRISLFLSCLDSFSRSAWTVVVLGIIATDLLFNNKPQEQKSIIILYFRDKL
jgi:hypothetical protein